jgi:hypothetical protein
MSNHTLTSASVFHPSIKTAQPILLHIPKLPKRKVQNSMKLNPMNTTGEKLHVFSQQSAAPLSPRKLETQKTQTPNMKPHKKQ